MTNLSLKDVAGMVINSIREGIFPDEALSEGLNKQPFIESLRNDVQAGDVNIVMGIFKQALTVHQYRLAINLLRRHKDMPRLKTFYQEQWNIHTGFDRRCTLMWRLLDDEFLTIDKHQEIYDFIKNNRDAWMHAQTEWIGGPSKLIPFITNSLTRADETESKKWAVLYNLIGVPDTEKAKKIVDPYKKSTDPFMKKVAEDLWDQLK